MLEKIFSSVLLLGLVVFNINFWVNKTLVYNPIINAIVYGLAILSISVGLVYYGIFFVKNKRFPTFQIGKQ